MRQIEVSANDRFEKLYSAELELQLISPSLKAHYHLNINILFTGNDPNEKYYYHSPLSLS